MESREGDRGRLVGKCGPSPGQPSKEQASRASVPRGPASPNHGETRFEGRNGPKGQPEEAWGGVCAADTLSMPTCQALGEGLPMTDTHESWNVFEQQLRGKDHAAPKGGRLP